MKNPLDNFGIRETNDFVSLSNQISLDVQRTKEQIKNNAILDAAQGDAIVINTQVNQEQSADITNIKQEIVQLHNTDSSLTSNVNAINVNIRAIDEKLIEHTNALSIKANENDINKKLEKKADISSVTSLSDSVDGIYETIDDIEERISEKANVSAVDELYNKLEAKADVTTIEGFNEAIADIEANKANTTDVENADNTIKTELIDYIDTNSDENQRNLQLLLSRINALENKVSELSQNNVEVVNNEEAVIAGVNEPSKYVVLNGEIAADETKTTATPVTVIAKSVELDNTIIKNNTRLSVKSDNVIISNSTIEGEFPKTNGGNAIMSINESSNVVIRDVEINNEGSNNYNAFEIGLNSNNLPKNILIDNCKFNGKLNNNAILVFATQDNATITISNCTFEDISNGLRISNKTNATGVTINIVNCSVDKWETTPEYSGFILFQDYTSQTVEETIENNLFGDEKITVNFINFKYQGEKVTKDFNEQLYYVYGNKTGLIKENKYQPIINIL